MLMEISNAFNNQLKYKGKDLDGIFSIFWTSFDGKIFIPFPSEKIYTKNDGFVCDFARLQRLVVNDARHVI